MKIITAPLLIFSLNLIFYVLFSTSVIAASINLSDAQPNVITDSNQEYQAKVNLSIDQSEGTVYYLRGVFYQNGSSNYCGVTWNGSSWFSGPYSSNDGWKNFLLVTISSSSASTILKAKLDTSDSGCRNNGTYNFKIQRFTGGGSANFDTQNEQTLTVNFPSPTPTSTPIPTPTSIPTSVPAASPTNSPSPSSTPKPQSTPTKYVSPTVKPSRSGSDLKVTEGLTPAVTQGTVLGEVSQVSATPAEEKIAGGSSKSSLPVFLGLLGSGLVFIGAAVILSIRQIKNRRHL